MRERWLGNLPKKAESHRILVYQFPRLQILRYHPKNSCFMCVIKRSQFHRKVNFYSNQILV